MPSKARVTGSAPVGSPTAPDRPPHGGSSGSSRGRRVRLSARQSPTCGTRIRASLPAAPTPIPAAECPRDGHRDIPRRMRRRSGRSAWRLPHGCGGCRRCAWKGPVRLRRSAPRASVRRYRRPPRPDRSAHFPAAGFPPPAPVRTDCPSFPAQDWDSLWFSALLFASFCCCRCTRSACSRSCLPRT